MYMKDQLPTLLSYEAALRHYNSVAPLRAGGKKGERPLGAVRRYIRSIIRLEPTTTPSAGNTAGNTENTGNDTVKDVVLSYYQNDVIRFKPDNRVIVNTCGWPSLSTFGFLSDILGMKLKFNRARSRIYYVQTGIGSHLLPTDGKSGVTIDLNTGEAIGGGDIDAYEIDRAAMTEVRRGFKEFITYAHDCIAMRTPVTVAKRESDPLHVTSSAFARNGYYKIKPQKDLRANVLALATRDATATEEQTLERYYEAFNKIAASALLGSPASRFYRSDTFDAAIDRQSFDKFFTNMLKLAYADKVFHSVRHESPMRKLPSDKNRFFIDAKDK